MPGREQSHGGWCRVGIFKIINHIKRKTRKEQNCRNFFECFAFFVVNDFFTVSAVVHSLYILPWAVAPAAENMARDWLLLEGFAGPDEPRLRTYGWTQPGAWTFGYSQPWAEVNAIAGPHADLVRRPTGGGLVDHRKDWTYALVLPPAHPLAQARATESYRAVHEALANALRAAGVPVELAKVGTTQANANPISTCFAQAEPSDVIRADDGRKVAGAAQKRARRGLLWQGSVSRDAAAEVKDWDAFDENFAGQLGALLGTQPKTWGQPACEPAALVEAVAKFSSAEWNRRR
jgi:lipoate-protein ligase A